VGPCATRRCWHQANKVECDNSSTLARHDGSNRDHEVQRLEFREPAEGLSTGKKACALLSTER
jgi:hypothetical protein